MMKVVNALRDIITGLYRSLKRFPVTILCSAAVGVTLVVISEMQPISNVSLREMLERLALIFALGIPLSLCLRLLSERKERGKVYILASFYCAGAVALILYYFFLLKDLNMVSITRYIGISLALYLGFLFIPYLPKREGYEMYIIKVFTGFFTTIIYSAVLFLGLSAILFTIDKLLGVRIEGKVYYYTWLFVASIFAPSYFLAGIPLKNQVYTPESYPKLFKILLLYIVMPLLTAYTIILYIYFGKIIITRQWPVGLVSHLVLWYSVIVAIVLFFITPVKGQSKWAGTFSSLLPKIIIPILIMMFVSIMIRINAYGITENRYYVVALGLWVFCIMIYLSFKKKPQSIILPVTLSAIALVSVLGPLSSYSISKLSQNNRLKSILVRNNMLSDGNIQTASLDIAGGDKYEISRILDYFDSNHSLQDVKYLPENFKLEDMKRVLGFDYQGAQYGYSSKYFYYTTDNTQKAVDISGYDYLFDSRSLYNKNELKDNIIDVIYNPETALVKINYKGNTVYSGDLQPFVENLFDVHGATDKNNTLSAEEMTLVDENEKVKVKFIFMSISGSRNVSTGDIDSKGFEFFTVVKIK